MAIIYVRKGGSDSNAGFIDDDAHAKLTIAGGLSALFGRDTLLIHGGTYVEGIIGANIPAGIPGDYTKIWGAAGETVIIQPNTLQRAIELDSLDGNRSNYVEFDNFVFDGVNTPHVDGVLPGPQAIEIDGIKISGLSGQIRIKNSEIKNFGGNGILIGVTGFNEFINLNVHDNGQTAIITDVIYLRYSHGFYVHAGNNLIDNCIVHDHNSGPVSAGITVFSASGQDCDSNVIRNCTLYNNYGVGAQITSGSGSAIYNCVAYSNGAAYDANYGSVDGFILNCTAHANTYGVTVGAGVNPGSGIAASGNRVVNCITDNNAVNTLDDGLGTIFDTNLADSAGPMVTIVGPALFVSKPDRNYRLTAASPARNAGLNISSIFTTDKDGQPRPPVANWDLGAYQFQPGLSVDLSDSIDLTDSLFKALTPVRIEFLDNSSFADALGLSMPFLLQVSDVISFTDVVVKNLTPSRIEFSDSLALLDVFSTALWIARLGVSDSNNPFVDTLAKIMRPLTLTVSAAEQMIWVDGVARTLTGGGVIIEPPPPPPPTGRIEFRGIYYDGGVIGFGAHRVD